MPYIQVSPAQLVVNQSYFIKENVHGANYNIGTAPRGTFLELTGSGAGEPVAKFLVAGVENTYSISGHTFYRQSANVGPAANVGPPNANVGPGAESANNPTEGSSSSSSVTTAKSNQSSPVGNAKPNTSYSKGGRRKINTRKQRQLRKQKRDRKTRQRKQRTRKH